MPGILEGVKVLELGEQVSAPFCARLLADYGADVIMVERRERATPPGVWGLLLAMTPTRKRASLFCT